MLFDIVVQISSTLEQLYDDALLNCALLGEIDRDKEHDKDGKEEDHAKDIRRMQEDQARRAEAERKKKDEDERKNKKKRKLQALPFFPPEVVEALPAPGVAAALPAPGTLEALKVQIANLPPLPTLPRAQALPPIPPLVRVPAKHPLAASSSGAEGVPNAGRFSKVEPEDTDAEMETGEETTASRGGKAGRGGKGGN